MGLREREAGPRLACWAPATSLCSAVPPTCRNLVGEGLASISGWDHTRPPHSWGSAASHPPRNARRAPVDVLGPRAGCERGLSGWDAPLPSSAWGRGGQAREGAASWQLGRAMALRVWVQDRGPGVTAASRLGLHSLGHGGRPLRQPAAVSQLRAPPVTSEHVWSPVRGSPVPRGWPRSPVGAGRGL